MINWEIWFWKRRTKKSEFRKSTNTERYTLSKIDLNLIWVIF